MKIDRTDDEDRGTTVPVFVVDPHQLSDLAVGDEFHLGGDEGRHAATVKRLTPEERLDLVDGSTGIRVKAVVTDVDRDALDVQVTEIAYDDDPTAMALPHLVLVQAIAKGGRDEQAVETATEYGVRAVIPWQAERSISVWKPEKAMRRADKWRNIARTAAKQSRRSLIPEIRDLLTGQEELIAAVRDAVDLGSGVLVLHETAEEKLSQVTLPQSPADELWIITGPEGGISPDELNALVEAGAVPVRMGEAVLRTSSAGPAAIAVINVRLNRW